MKALFIQNKTDLSKTVQALLSSERISLNSRSSGTDGLIAARQSPPNIILLENELTDIGSLQVLRLLKDDEKTKNIPVILIATTSEEIVSGFKAGADEGILKPLHPEELLFRVKAILKRTELTSEEEDQTYGSIKIDASRYEVTVDGEKAPLTPLEFKLLRYFLSSRGRVATRDLLLDHVWGYNIDTETRTVDASIKRLRTKLGTAGNYIETIRGVGYRIREQLEATRSFA